KRFCEGFELHPDTPGMATNPQRVENSKRVKDMVQRAFALYGTDELLAPLHRIGVPAGRIRTIREVYEWEQTQSQGLLIDVDHATLGIVMLPGPPLPFPEPTPPCLPPCALARRCGSSTPTVTNSPVVGTPPRRCSAPTMA